MCILTISHVKIQLFVAILTSNNHNCNIANDICLFGWHQLRNCHVWWETTHFAHLVNCFNASGWQYCYWIYSISTVILALFFLSSKPVNLTLFPGKNKSPKRFIKLSLIVVVIVIKPSLSTRSACRIFILTEEFWFWFCSGPYTTKMSPSKTLLCETVYSWITDEGWALTCFNLFKLFAMFSVKGAEGVATVFVSGISCE